MIKQLLLIAGLLLCMNAKGQGTYDPLIQNQVAYIRGLQLADGAIMDNGQPEAGNAGYRITPYNGNLAAIGLLAQPTADNVAAVRHWMQWYLRHLNDTDGYINDFYTPSPQDTSHYNTQRYDSRDSYAATLLSLARKYGELSNANTSWLKQNNAFLERIAGVINDCIQVNGLSIAMPEDSTYFAMDNAEVNKALQDIQWLVSRQILRPGTWAKKLTDNTAAYEKFWDAGNGTYDYALDDNSLDWKTFYPSGTAQFFPAMYGVISYNSPRAVSLWNAFNTHYPGWVNGEVLTMDGSTWSAMAYAALVMHDDARAKQYLKWYQGYLAAPAARQFPYWTDAVAAFVIIAGTNENH